MYRILSILVLSLQLLSCNSQDLILERGDWDGSIYTNNSIGFKIYHREAKRSIGFVVPGEFRYDHEFDTLNIRYEEESPFKMNFGNRNSSVYVRFLNPNRAGEDVKRFLMEKFNKYHDFAQGSKIEDRKINNKNYYFLSIRYGKSSDESSKMHYVYTLNNGFIILFQLDPQIIRGELTLPEKQELIDFLECVYFF